MRSNRGGQGAHSAYNGAEDENRACAGKRSGRLIPALSTPLASISSSSSCARARHASAGPCAQPCEVRTQHRTSADASLAGGLAAASFAHGKAGSFFQTCTALSMTAMLALPPRSAPGRCALPRRTSSAAAPPPRHTAARRPGRASGAPPSRGPAAGGTHAHASPQQNRADSTESARSWTVRASVPIQRQTSRRRKVDRVQTPRDVYLQLGSFNSQSFFAEKMKKITGRRGGRGGLGAHVLSCEKCQKSQVTLCDSKRHVNREPDQIVAC